MINMDVHVYPKSGHDHVLLKPCELVQFPDTLSPFIPVCVVDIVFKDTQSKRVMRGDDGYASTIRTIIIAAFYFLHSGDNKEPCL